MSTVGMSPSCYRFTLFYAVPVFLERHIAPQSCPTLCNSMECSTPGFPVLRHLPEFPQTNVRWVNNAIQSSHPLLPPSPPALNLSQHQDVFQWVDSLHQVAKVLELQRSHQSFQWIFTVGLGWTLGWTGLLSLLSKGLSRAISPTTFWKHQFFSAQPSLWSSSHIQHTWLQEKPYSFDNTDLCQQSNIFAF